VNCELVNVVIIYSARLWRGAARAVRRCDSCLLFYRLPAWKLNLRM